MDQPVLTPQEAVAVLAHMIVGGKGVVLIIIDDAEHASFSMHVAPETKPKIADILEVILQTLREDPRRRSLGTAGDCPCHRTETVGPRQTSIRIAERNDHRGI